jgi:Uma2 family endonuclease
MSTLEEHAIVATNSAVSVSLEDRLSDLGGISAARLRDAPAPGTATLEDLIVTNRSGDRLYELVDGSLVEKAMGWQESLLAMVIARWLGNFVEKKRLGVVIGPDGMTRLFDKTVRAADVAFVSWQKMPSGKLPEEPVPQIVPDFVVEVLSVGNTRSEMARKRREYFQAGVQLVWMVDPQVRTVAVYTDSDSFRIVDEEQTIGAGDLLPGWEIDLGKLFAELDGRAAPE